MDSILTEELQRTIKLHIASSIAYPHEIMTVVLVTVIHVVKLKQHCRLSIIVGWNDGMREKSMSIYAMNNNQRHDSVWVKLMVTYQCQSQDKPIITTTMIEK